MTYGKKPERNAAICRRFHSGESVRSIAADLGLSHSAVWAVIARYAPLTDEQRTERLVEYCRKNLLRPEIVARSREGMKRRIEREGIWNVGRKKVLAHDPAKREDYLALRRAYGAKYAREALGVAA